MSTSNGNHSSSSPSSYSDHPPSNTNPQIKISAMNRVSGDNKIADLSKLVGVELEYVEESFETAKVTIDRVFVQMKEARIKFDQLLIMQHHHQHLEATRGGGETDTNLLLPLQELKVKVSNLKSKIPFNLILPSKSEHLTSNPHFNWIPRNAPHHRLEVPPPPPPSHPIPTVEDLQGLNALEKVCLCFLGDFPEDAIIKKSLLLDLLGICMPEVDEVEELVDKCVTNGLLKPIYKQCNLIVSGYWVHPLARSPFGDKQISENSERTERSSNVYITQNIDQEDIFFDLPLSNGTKWVVLHFGKWQKLSNYHAEFVDLDLFFKYVPTQDFLTYLSFRGISMIKELPKFISKLKSLKTLDVKACHNLEVIPSEISNLKYTLRRLDMSECYFLEHMPLALAELKRLRVLKGFFVGQTNKEDTCTLKDLSHLRELVKLNIYTNVEEFPNDSELASLQSLEELRNLTISWGGCTIPPSAKRRSTFASEIDQERLVLENDPVFRDRKCNFNLEKLDLQCVPSIVTYSWLKPDNFKSLKKLYVRGGQLYDLGPRRHGEKNSGYVLKEKDQWSVEMLRLKYLNKLKMDWHELETFCPNLIFLEKIECPNLTSCPTDDSGIWMNTTQ